jgi:hypothetical protein
MILMKEENKSIRDFNEVLSQHSLEELMKTTDISVQAGIEAVISRT